MLPRRDFLAFLILNLTFQLTIELGDDLKQKRIKHEATEIPLHKLTAVTQSDMQHLQKAIDTILIPRVVGTPGHEKVRDYIVSSMEELGWSVTKDTFEDTAPIVGKLTFDNVIAKLNPKAERYLMLACHYDSKFFTDHEFLGATDSAVPCAMLLNLAHVMRNVLNTAKTNQKLSLMFVFFDGEEAFLEWSPQDSIYGARHLARKWNDENFLQRIDCLMLLDLLGTSDPKFYSYFQDTENLYSLLISAEERLATNGHLNHYTASSAAKAMPNRYFNALSANSYIEDDHTPFLKLNVPILHVIPVPFPKVWHKPGDNADVIDIQTVENLNKIFRVFVIEYLNIDL